MIRFLIVLLTIIAILLVLFVAWFMILKANGNCPLCAMKRVLTPRKLTIDTSECEDYNEGIITAPPMGWSSWNTFRNHIDQELIEEIGDALVASGLAEAGYQYVNLDDCWQSSRRDADGKLQGDLRTFSDGIPELVKKLNEKGLKVGIYSSNGDLTCEDMPASLGNELLDARTFASWGIEFLKYDFCHHHSISSKTPLIELIELNKIGERDYITLAPEDAEYTGRAKTVQSKDLPTGQAIGFISHGSGTATLRTPELEEGDYNLTIVYGKDLTRKPKYVQVIANGELHEVSFPTGFGFSDNGRVQIKVTLKEGVNELVLKNPVATFVDSSFIQYQRMGRALRQASREWAEFTGAEEKPIVFSICEWGHAKPYLWGAKAGNMWRTTHDIFPVWKSIRLIYEHTVDKYEYARVGAYNDPDMLEVGNGKLTENENIAHFSLWCMMGAPLMLGNDVRKLLDGNGEPVNENPTLKILTNKQLIAIDQDLLGKACKRISKSGGVDVLAKPLSNGDVALCFFNKHGSRRTARFNLDALTQDEYLNFGKVSSYEIHDLWNDERSVTTNISTSLPAHSVKVYRVKTI
ncbi:MAG: alpha-galactosidase [Eubacterium sp.]|nr:alpha-galactosidase [Eubacterium sp.]